MIYRSKINPVDYSALKDLQIAFGWSNDQLDYLIACMMFEPTTNHLRRISLGTGCFRTGSGTQSAQPPQRGTSSNLYLYLARPQRGAFHERPGAGDVQRKTRRAQRGG